MKVFERSKSASRSSTPKRILAKKPPFPKLIQKKPKLIKPSAAERNKENIPVQMILPQDTLIKPNEISGQSLYTQSPIGEQHVCFPYELPTRISRFEMPANSSFTSTKEITQTNGSTPSVGRNNRVKLLSKNFIINRNAMTKFCKGISQNLTPEPREM